MVAAESNDEYYDHYCPSCGNDNCVIVLELGWCLNCVREYHPNIRVCDCGTIIETNTYGKYCRRCKENKWLEKNADAMEAYMENGLSANKARERVYKDNRPVCLSCGEPIVRGRVDGNSVRYFCFKPKCREWYHTYHLIRRKPGVSQDDALVIIRDKLRSSRESSA